MSKRIKFVLACSLFLSIAAASAQGQDKPAKFRRLPVQVYVDKMKAGWLGQMAGVGLGGPTEFRKRGEIIPENETPVWKPALINQFNQDDIYVEMTFLRTLEVYGLDVSIRQAGIDFAKSRYGLACANATGRDNLRRGIAPPDSSHPKFSRNADDIDYQIEADYSGLIAPGMPNMPIELGEKFGRLMNYGDGMYAGQFVGGMYTEAFFENDLVKIISTRCGQDSDCNPANAGGVLFTTIGFSKVPEKFKSALNPKGKFSHTPYDFPTLTTVCEKLARQVVERSGGRVEKAPGGEEVFVIPVVAPKPSKLERSWAPGPIANSKFTEAEMEKISYGAPAEVIAGAKKVFPGWIVNNCGYDMKPGLIAEWKGKENILMTHPFNGNTGCTLSRKVKIPKGKTTLLLSVSHHPSGDWDLIVKANDKQLLKQKIGKDTVVDSWKDIAVELTEFAGQEVKLKLVNQANGWSCEAGYWAKIEIISK